MTLPQFLDNVTDQDAEVIGVPLAPGILRQEQPESSPADLALLEKHFLNLADYDFSAFCGSIPRITYRERVILHAFSGRRRAGDFQFFVEHIVEQNPAVAFVVLSVDIVIDPVWGNVANPKTKLDAARRGLVRAFIGGPPCETWSIEAIGPQNSVRHTRAPRILRTSASLWGLRSTSLREKSQLMVGRELLMFSFQLVAILACTSGFAVLEHPSEPSEKEAASIWKLPTAQFLLNLPCVQRLEFSQGLMGAFSKKPATLMTLNLPDLMRTLHCHRVTSLIPRGGSIGLSNDGTFKTGGLKEYPPALCLALASAFTAAMSSSHAEGELPADFASRCKDLIATEFGSHMGQDYAV